MPEITKHKKSSHILSTCVRNMALIFLSIPKISSSGLYTIRVGEPDSNIWKEIPDIQASSSKQRKSLDVNFQSTDHVS
jgi:hypothetical protein